MASRSNVPKEILDSIRDSVDRRIKLSIKRLVKYEVRPDRWENRVVAFSNNRIYMFTAKNPTKVENKFHYLDLHSIESPKSNKLILTFGEKSHSFTTVENDTDEVDIMITHICISLKTIFPAFPIERLIKKIDVQPSDRLRAMHDMVNTIEQKESGPCGGFTLMYDCMCEYHELPYRDEVAWDVDTIYLSQDSKELCLRDFDHLNPRDLVPIVSALLHNPWFTVLNCNNVKLSPEVCTEIIHVVLKNSVIESLQLKNTGITNDFLQKLSTSILSMSNTQLHKIDISDNPLLDDRGIIHLIGSLSSLGKGMTYLDLSKTRLSTKGIRAIAETMSKNSQVFSSLQTLKLKELSSGKGEDLQMLYTFLAQPSMISHLDLSGTDCELERLMAPLQRGCSQSITFLKLSRTAFTNKRVKETVVPSSFKQFFSTVYSLKTLNLSGCKIPPEALKELLLGLGSNRNLSNVHLNLSSVDLPSQGIQTLQNSLSQLNNITSLNLSNIVFTDQDLCGLLTSIGQNKNIKHLSIGRVFQKVKPTDAWNFNMVMEALVHVIQDEESVIESLSLADSRLKSNMNQIINALGSNNSLTELDISGNSMGDLGARMLSKALQINNRLKTIMWDRNNTTAQGFEDIADALEKNYTLRKMPVPISDASQAARAQPERTEAALQAIERLLQRNHSPQKYSSDQGYRLQQGFLISSTQQMIDRLVVQSQDTINALSIDPLDSYTSDIEFAKALIKEADNSKTLLPKLHDIAIESQNPGNPVENKVKQIAEELKDVLEKQMRKNVEKMIESTRQQCKAIMGDQVFLSALQAGCSKNSTFPKDFTTNILASVDNEIFNKVSELNLAVAAHVSDRILDEVIDRLSKSHKTLTNHLNIKKKSEIRASKTKSEKLNLDNTDAAPKSNSPQASPKVTAKRQSMLNRKLRPQSVIDTIDSVPEPETKVSKSVKVKKQDEDILGDLPTLNVEGQKLTHLTTGRPRITNRTNRTRPTTRKSQLPGTNEAIDEGLDDFFVSKSDGPSLTPGTKVTPDSKKTGGSNKPESETKKKHGLFGRSNSKDKEHKSGGLFGKLKKSSKSKGAPKSPSGKLVGVVEEVDGVIHDDAGSQKSSDGSQRSSQEKRRSNQSLNSIGKKLTGSEADSSSLKSQESEHSGNVNVNSSENLEDNDDDVGEEREDKTESGTEEGTTEEELDEAEDEEESKGNKIEKKKPLELPKIKRSFNKISDLKSETNDSVKTVENGSKTEEDVDKKETDKGEDSKDNVSEVMISDSEKKTEEEVEEKEEKKEEQPSPKLPAGIPKKVGGLPGLGGVNMMAELKAKQEKRKSMAPSGTKLSDKSPTASAGEKSAPFGAVNLKSVGDRKSKEKLDKTEHETNDSQATVRPSGLKQSEQSKTERPLSSGKQPSSSEPAETKLAGPAKKPVIPSRPKPPPITNKPKPAPRRSLQSDGDEVVEETEKTEDKTEDKKDTVDSSSPRTSVKDMIAGLRHSGDQSELLKQGKPQPKSDSTKVPSPLLSKTKIEDKEKDGSIKKDLQTKPKADDKEKEKDESVKRDSRPGSDKKAEAEVKHALPVDKKKDLKEDDSVKSGHSPEAGLLDHKTEENKEMTDSGIVYDSDTLKLSVKDKISRFGSKDDVSEGRSSPKTSSLTRGMKPSDMKDADTPKRPRSMFAVLESHPGLKKHDSDNKRDLTPKIKEETKEDVKDSKEAGSPTEDIVMV